MICIVRDLFAFYSHCLGTIDVIRLVDVMVKREASAE